MPSISLPSPGQKPWNLNPAITALNDEMETGRLSVGALNSTFAERAYWPRDRFASGFVFGNAGSFPTGSNATNILNDTRMGGPRPLMLCFHLGFDSGTLKIGQFGWTGNTASEANYDAAVNQLLSEGFTIAGVKVHNPGLPSGGFNSTFWTNYAALVNQLAVKYQGVAPWFFVTNEYDIATTDAAQTSYLNSIITNVKSKGYLAGMSFVGTAEASRCTVIDNLDVVGMNVYPSVSSLGAKTSREQVHAALRAHGFIDFFRDLKLARPSVITVISEIGTSDTTISLEYTAMWNISALPDNAGSIVGLYWDGIWTLAQTETLADYIHIWDEHRFSPWRFPASLAVMNKYLEGAEA